ncbi:MAG TPA: hypothetical protein PKD64_19170 [Pirellulaceae bacterium]|nr:hypothetical protein [Pirellulaceae bacterium]HMO94312.1 hypothetical protein [Pirellulaceae bacterium]HMP71557.1 hypothetical protein [Pirellulaceae bacterium]
MRLQPQKERVFFVEFIRTAAYVGCCIWLLFPPPALGQEKEVQGDKVTYKVVEQDWAIEITTRNGFVHAVPIVPLPLARLFDSTQVNQLDLIDSQRRDFNDLAADSMHQAVRKLDDWISRNEDDDSAVVAITEALGSISEELEKEVRSRVLLRHQLDLVDRYPIYLMTIRNGLFRMLTYGPLGESVELTAEQRKQLEETADKMRKKIIDTVIELEDELHRELTSVLNPEQRKVVDAMRTDFVRRQNYNLNNVIQQLDRSTIGSCAGCDASKVVLPIPKTDDSKLRSVLDK